MNEFNCIQNETDGPIIHFKSSTYDFDTVLESRGLITCHYVFENTGLEPLVITQVRSSCGCLVPSWPKHPIAPQTSDSIKATLSIRGRPGPNYKTLTVMSNARNTPVRILVIKGVVKR